MKRRSFALSASVALLSMVITGCANFHSGDSSNGEMPTSSIIIEATEPSSVYTEVVSTTTSNDNGYNNPDHNNRNDDFNIDNPGDDIDNNIGGNRTYNNRY